MLKYKRREREKNQKYVQTVFFDIKGCFHISVFEIRRVNYIYKHYREVLPNIYGIFTIYFSVNKCCLTLLHSKWPKLYRVLVILSAIGLIVQ